MGFRRHILKGWRSYYFKKIILILVFLLVLTFLFLTIRFFIKKDYNTTGKNSDNLMSSIFKEQNKSIFNIRELNSKELKGRIILLNVYNIKDFSYIFSVDLANRLEKQFKNKVAIIDVITDSIVLDKDTVINYIIKNNIERPAINIANFDIYDKNIDGDDRYFVLIDTKGMIANTFLAEDATEETISTAINNLISKQPKFNKDKLDLYLEKNSNPESFIKSLSHIKYIHKIDGTNNGPYFVVADSKGRKIYIMTINGNIINQIGNGQNGDDDKTGVNATFCYPSGLTIQNNKTLYVADICNNSIRKVDLKTLKVSTLIKDNPTLKRPIDVEILEDNLIIATAGDNQLLRYNLKNGELSNIECANCDKFITKLVKFNNKIYFILMNNHGLYSIDKNGKINMELNFEELNKNSEIKIKGNNNFHIDETGFYFVDKFNNRILKIKDNKIKEYSANNGKNIYNFPTDIVDYRDKLYITNEDDKKFVQLDKNTKATKVINISFGYEYNKLKNIEEEFLNVNNIKETVVKDGDDIQININLKNGYSFEEMAPQSLILYKEDRENKTAILIKAYSKTQILENSILDVPELDDNSVYYLKGNFYYCNYDKKTPCLINKYSRKIITDSDSKNKNIIINFVY